MTKNEWQKAHGLLDEEMDQISSILEVFNGSIVAVQEVPKYTSGKVIPFDLRYRQNNVDMSWLWSKRT